MDELVSGGFEGTIHSNPTAVEPGSPSVAGPAVGLRPRKRHGAQIGMDQGGGVGFEPQGPRPGPSHAPVSRAALSESAPANAPDHRRWRAGQFHAARAACGELAADGVQVTFVLSCGKSSV